MTLLWGSQDVGQLRNKDRGFTAGHVKRFSARTGPALLGWGRGAASMIQVIQRYIERRRAIARDSDGLMESMQSDDAWHEARSRGRDFLLSEHERTHWWRVAALIEARASIHRSTVGSSFAPPI
jgi:hypothetical protein